MYTRRRIISHVRLVDASLYVMVKVSKAKALDETLSLTGIQLLGSGGALTHQITFKWRKISCEFTRKTKKLI